MNAPLEVGIRLNLWVLLARIQETEEERQSGCIFREGDDRQSVLIDDHSFRARVGVVTNGEQAHAFEDLRGGLEENALEAKPNAVGRQQHEVVARCRKQWMKCERFGSKPWVCSSSLWSWGTVVGHSVQLMVGAVDGKGGSVRPYGSSCQEWSDKIRSDDRATLEI